MPHVQLTQDEHFNTKLLLDGVDITHLTARDGLTIGANPNLPGVFQATITLMSIPVDIDLPECLVKIINAPEVTA